MATVHPPPPPPIAQPQFAFLSRPHADAGAADDYSDSESVAESSCPCRPTAGRDYDGEDDEDGCSSCVEGHDECCYLERQEAADEEDVVSSTGTGSVIWWKGQQLPAAARAQAKQQRRREEEEMDPKRLAARQEEDPKFWEDCLGTGYP